MSPMRFQTWLVPWDSAEPGEADCFDDVRPFALALSSDSNVVVTAPKLLAAAQERRKHGDRLIPVLVNDVFVNGKSRSMKSQRALETLFSSESSMSAHIAQLLDAARDFDGLEIDYERVPDALWGRYTEFIGRLATDLHREGKKLYVDIEPQLLYSDRWPTLYGRAIAARVDGFQLMDYYERSEASLAPGPGTSLAWSVETARRALLFVPPKKFVAVFSLAGMDWTEDMPGVLWRGARLHYGQALKLMLESRSELRWDEAAACPYFNAVLEGRQHQIWFENEHSIARKIDALRGIGAVRIGLWYWGRRHPDFRELGLCVRKGS